MVDIKSSSNAVWWIKKPKQLERPTQSLGTKLCQDMTDLFRNISLHGYDKLFDTKLLIYEKFIWLCLLLSAFAAGMTLLSHTWDQFVLQSFVVNLYDPLHPIENIPFPAVSICSNNRISRQAAEKYAYELSFKDPRNRSMEYFFERIPILNGLYYKFDRADDLDKYDNFQNFLGVFGTAGNETHFDMEKIMKMTFDKYTHLISQLTPKCEDLIVRCKLAGEQINCFSKNAFQNSLTMYGPCCTFNSQDSYRKRELKDRFVGPIMGLTVLLNSSNADDVVSLLNINGYVVIIHNPNIFPDISSGNSLEVFPMHGDDSYIAIKAKFIDTGENLRTFQPSFRKCYFENEAPDHKYHPGDRYSFNNCITRCRIRSIIALCRCIPFYYTLELLQTISVPQCNLHHIDCLQSYSFKWSNVLTRRSDIMGLERELEEALYCPQCLPSCNDIQYDISMMSLLTNRNFVLANEGYNVNDSLQNMSELHVYFYEPSALYYKRVINNTWEEALSTVGNILSIFVGVSLVALFEMLFFILKYLYVTVCKIISSHNKKTNKQIKPNTKLYILP